MVNVTDLLLLIYCRRELPYLSVLSLSNTKHLTPRLFSLRRSNSARLCRSYCGTAMDGLAITEVSIFRPGTLIDCRNLNMICDDDATDNGTPTKISTTATLTASIHTARNYNHFWLCVWGYFIRSDRQRETTSKHTFTIDMHITVTRCHINAPK